MAQGKASVQVREMQRLSQRIELRLQSVDAVQQQQQQGGDLDH